MVQANLPLPRYIYVNRSEQVSAHLQRIYFSTDNFADLSPLQNGAHIKLFFPEQADAKPQLPYRNEAGKMVWLGSKPITRTYTLHQVLQKEQLLVIDFVRHADFGIASDWAIHAKPGHVLGLAGPGGPERFNHHAKYWVFIGDLSALPMISASLQQLPPHAQGQVWIEIEDSADQMILNAPSEMQINWIIQNEQAEAKIIHAMQQLDWQSEHISVSLAGENTRVIALRQLFKTQFKCAKANLYAVPYWKQGESEECYHEQRHLVMDS